jgi:DegV family protein with EDD domain
MPELTLDNTAFVLDSTCDAAPGFFDQPGFFLVPLTVHFGDQSFRDGIDLTHEEFYAKLESSNLLPTTSQPTVADFTAVYEKATARYEHVFSLHISSKMSGTFGAAERAAQAIPGVEAYDLRTVTCGLSMCALRLGARLEQGGMSLAEARAYIEHYRTRPLLLVHAGTLEYLRRGGRIGRAASLVGGVFDIKPLIHLVDGELSAYAKVRGQKKALGAMERFIDEYTKPDDAIYYCLIDAMNEVEPPLIREMIERKRPNAQLLCSTRVGAVVGTHIGPGSAAFAMIVE